MPTRAELKAFMQGYEQREREVRAAIAAAQQSKKDTAQSVAKSYAAGNWMLRIELKGAAP